MNLQPYSIGEYQAHCALNQQCFLQAMMDRGKKDKLPEMQIGFIDGICLPVYKVGHCQYFFV